MPSYFETSTKRTKRETSYKRDISTDPLASFVTVASTNERKRSSPALERNVGSLPRVWSCPSRSIFWAGPVVAGIAAFPGTRQQVENRRNAQLTPAALDDSLVCAFLLRRGSLCGGEDCVCRRSRGVESHLNRRYLISATPHWRIRPPLVYALYDRYKFHDRDPYLYRDPCSCVP